MQATNTGILENFPRYN